MVNIIEDGNSGCEPKRKRVHQKNKLFTSRSENTRRSKHLFKIRNTESVNAEYCKFQVGSVTLPAHSIKYICVLSLFLLRLELLRYEVYVQAQTVCSVVCNGNDKYQHSR